MIKVTYPSTLHTFPSQSPPITDTNTAAGLLETHLFRICPYGTLVYPHLLHETGASAGFTYLQRKTAKLHIYIDPLQGM